MGLGALLGARIKYLCFSRSHAELRGLGLVCIGVLNQGHEAGAPAARRDSSGHIFGAILPLLPRAAPPGFWSWWELWGENRGAGAWGALHPWGGKGSIGVNTISSYVFS